MTSTDTGALPIRQQIDPQGLKVISLLLIAGFVAILNETTMGIAIPALNEDLGLAPELGQWMTSAFMLTMAVVIPTTGFLLQRFSTRQVFLASMTMFSLGTVICLIAPGFTILLLGRVVQAIGTGIMMPLLMTTIMNVVPPRSRGRIMGFVGMVISLAPAIGPTLSGAVIELANWRWLFAIILPIAIIALLIGAKWITNLGESSHAPLDIPSVILSAFAFGSIVFGLSQFGTGHTEQTESAAPEISPATLGAITLSVGLVILVVFVWRQLRLQKRDRALLNLKVFQSGNFTVSVIIMAILAMAMFGTLTLLPLYLQDVVGLDPLRAGLILLPGSVLMGILAPIMGRIYDAKGPKALLIPGTVIVTSALFFYATVNETTEAWVLTVTQTLMSIGMAMSFTPLFSASLGSLKRQLYSHGSAVLNTLQQVAGAAGVAILIALYSSILHAGEQTGLTVPVAGAPGARMAFLIAAIIALVAVVLAFFVKTPDDQEVAPASHQH